MMVNKILSCRKEKGLTQAQLSELTGINRTMIGRIENNDYIPTMSAIVRTIADLG